LPAVVEIEDHYTNPPDQNPNLYAPGVSAVTAVDATRYGSTYDFNQIEPSRIDVLSCWGFENAEDGCGSTDLGNNGAVFHAAGGKFGGYYSFDGSANLEVENGPLSSQSPARGITGAAWIKAESGNGMIFEQAFSDFAMQLDGGSLTCLFSDTANGIGTVGAPFDSALLNRWTHAACLYDNQNREIRLYINGALAGSAPFAITKLSGSQGRFSVGSRTNTLPPADREGFRGGIDELYIWNRALSAADIQVLAASQSALNPLAPSSFVSKRIDPQIRFSDVKVDWVESASGVLLEVSTDAGRSWCEVANGQSLAALTSNCRLPAQGLAYRVTFRGNTYIDQVHFTFTRDSTETTRAYAPLGMNLAGINDGSSEMDFIDLFKAARPWLTQNADGSGEYDTGYGDQIPADANGYPVQVPFVAAGQGGQPTVPQRVHTVIIGGQAMPTGDYTFSFDGQGELTLIVYGGTGSQEFVLTSGGSHKITIAEPKADFAMTISRTQSGNPLRNFKLLLPGYTQAQAEQNPFHPAVLERLAGMQVLRFMDWGFTNNNPTQHWADRTTPSSYTQARLQGAALEYMIMLANRLRIDPWICIPHMADDDYIQKAAALVAARLDPSLKVYVEYSNEVWNGIFDQAIYADQHGGTRFIASRFYKVFDIFDQTLGDERVVNVVAGFGADPQYNAQLLDYQSDPAVNPTGRRAEALAVAPYFGYDLANETYSNNEDRYMTVEGLLDRLETTVRDNFLAITQQNKEVTDQRGVRLVAYEGGQHLVGVYEATNNALLSELLIGANRHPRMEQIYTDMFSEWGRLVNDVFSVFSYIQQPSKWGSWGVLETQNQKIADAPKYRAVRSAAEGYLLREGLAAASCGNGVREAGEDCDGSDFGLPQGSALCSDYSDGLASGRLSCAADCKLSTLSCTPKTDCELSAVRFDNNDYQALLNVGTPVKLLVTGQRCQGRSVTVEVYEADEDQSDERIGSFAFDFRENTIGVGSYTPAAIQDDESSSYPQLYLKTHLTDDPTVSKAMEPWEGYELHSAP
jgi:hypothetical protein